MKISVEEKQKCLYAALIRYSSDAQTLRERAVDHLVLIALQDTNEEKAMSSGDLRRSIGRGLGTEGLRVEVVQESLIRFIELDFVEEIKIRHKNKYFVTKKGEKELLGLSKHSDKIIIPCINRMLEGYEYNGNSDDIKQICTRFIIYSFVDYGHTMAKCVTGEINNKNISQLINVQATFLKSIDGFRLTVDEKDSLYSRCLIFLKSNDQKDVEVKFLLTQSFYMGKVLELDDKDFDPLAESTFKGAVIYIDSNVVFDALFDLDDENLFDDLVDVAGKLNIELCITQSTIEEINRVINNKSQMLESIVTKLPDELYLDSKDHLLRGFIKFQKENPGAIPKEFLGSLGDIRNKMESKGIVYKALDIVEDFNINDIEHISKIVSDEAKAIRGHGKSENVAAHDAAHLLLVKNNRSNDIKSWFLTKDGSLAAVSNKVQSNHSLIFSLSSFLQCISPFVQGKSSNTLYHLFEKVLEDDVSVAGVGGLFELSELQIISEFHLDVIATEPEQLHRAFEFVKSSYLDGNEITQKNQHKVHLSLKKFLKSGVDEQKLALQEEIDRKNSDVLVMQDELLAQKELEKQLIIDNEILENNLKNSKSENYKLNFRRFLARGSLFVFGLVLSSALWMYDDKILEVIIYLELFEQGNIATSSKIYLRALGSVFFVLMSTPVCLLFKKEITGWLLTCIFMISLYNLKFVSVGLLSDFSNYIGVAILMAGLYSWIIRR